MTGRSWFSRNLWYPNRHRLGLCSDVWSPLREIYDWPMSKYWNLIRNKLWSISIRQMHSTIQILHARQSNRESISRTKMQSKQTPSIKPRCIVSSTARNTGLPTTWTASFIGSSRQASGLYPLHANDQPTSMVHAYTHTHTQFCYSFWIKLIS